MVQTCTAPILWLQKTLVTERHNPTGLTGYKDCWLQRKAAESTTVDRQKAVSYESIPAKKFNSPS